MPVYNEWFSAQKKVLVVHDELVPEVSDRLRLDLGADWIVEGYTAYEPAAAFLEANPDVFSVISDQKILLTDRQEDAANASPNYGDRLVREASELSAEARVPRLVVQWTSSSVTRGFSSAYPVFRCKCSSSKFADMLRYWEAAIQRACRDIDLEALVLNDSTLRGWLERGTEAWVAVNTQDINECFLRAVHDCRHDALSPYLAVYNDVQNIDYWRSPDFKGSDSCERIEAALARIAVNAKQVARDGALPQIGGLLSLEMPLVDGAQSTVKDYLTSGKSETLEPVDRYPGVSNGKSACNALDDVLQAERSLREVCTELANVDITNENNIGGRDRLGCRFEQHFEDLKQSMEVIVQFFEKRFRDPQRKE